ncbi:EAL domain-containing protein [Arcobacter peruensis]|uniref:EAL domain-containing protein n=1 Tax=Arcobacter peruensis TaxID=2320140 RepID=UPI000F07EB13|nr:EAL domain-containing protein [Arcobacter peruensis]
MSGNLISNKSLEISSKYNKLEELYKLSQQAENTFKTIVLNEYRYFSRAMVDYTEATSDEKKINALSRAEVAISAAYNDIIDSLIMNIKKFIHNVKIKYSKINVAVIFKKYHYEELLKAIEYADKMIINSRGTRVKRFDIYYDFSISEEYKSIVDFCLKFEQIEYDCALVLHEKDIEEEPVLNEKIINLFNGGVNTRCFLELYFQPKFDKSKKVVGAEALVRLKENINSEEVKTYYPDEFLFIINENGLNDSLDKQVIEMACDVLKKWNNNRLINSSFDLSINITPSFASNQVFPLFINNNIDEDLSKLLSIELLESWNKDENIDVNYRLEELNKNIKISIDDFGTGSTKLEYLTRINNLHKIKIDKLLIDGLLSHSKDKYLKLIQGIYLLANNMGFDVVAEGIEENEQLKLLNEIGINEYQGYLVSEPLTEESFLEFYKNNK